MLLNHLINYERGNSRFSEESINDYLILLIIQQTCKYRGIDFLDFLKSGEKNIDNYC